jgi:hypothetical protein
VFERQLLRLQRRERACQRAPIDGRPDGRRRCDIHRLVRLPVFAYGLEHGVVIARETTAAGAADAAAEGLTMGDGAVSAGAVTVSTTTTRTSSFADASGFVVAIAGALGGVCVSSGRNQESGIRIQFWAR